MRRLVRDAGFLARHRRCPTDFTRHRLLDFPTVMLLLLQKTSRSIQRHLNEFFCWVDGTLGASPATTGAWTQARAKVRHTALIELNDTLVLPAAYDAPQRESLRLWHGHRLVGMDSSLLRLPMSPTVKKAFGVLRVSNQSGDTGTAYPEGRLSVVYDLLNALGWDAQLQPSTVGEVQMATAQLRSLKPGDVLIVDRGYPSFEFFAAIFAAQAHFVARCSRGSFAQVQELFARDEAGVRRIVTLQRPRAKRLPGDWSALPETLRVRLVTVRLSTGQLEVLATSLLDETLYPSAEFADLYHLRWGQETYYLMLKSRLDLGNWSGQTEEAVRQDLAACVLVSNLESLFTRPAQAQLDAGSGRRQHPLEVNRAVAFHAIKTHALDLLHGDAPPQEVLLRLQALFVTSPVSRRPGRSSPRRNPSPARSYHHQRHVRKTVF